MEFFLLIPSFWSFSLEKEKTDLKINFHLECFLGKPENKFKSADNIIQNIV